MASPKDPIRIELTPEQKSKVRNATGKDAEAVELSVEELEERIAPRKKGSGFPRNLERPSERRPPDRARQFVFRAYPLSKIVNASHQSGHARHAERARRHRG